MQEKISAEKFKVQCLKLIDYVNQKHVTFLITKDGIPIAKLSPAKEEPILLFGALEGTLKIKEDIIAPWDEEWTTD